MMNLAAASDLLLNKAGADLNYINRRLRSQSEKQMNLLWFRLRDRRHRTEVQPGKAKTEPQYSKQ